MYKLLLLTNCVNQLEVYVERDQWDWQKSEIEFQHTGDGVDIIVAFNRNVGLFTICQHKRQCFSGYQILPI